VLAASGLVPRAQTPAQAAGQGQSPGRGQGRGQPGGQGRGGGAGTGQADPWPGKKKLLAVADTQSGFHHDSISHALATVEQIGRQSGAYITIIATDSQLITKGDVVGTGRYEGRGVNARTLDYYDAIFMLPSGYGVLSEQQKKDLLTFVHDDGKGLVVGHATGVAFTNWPDFGEMVGGYMDSEFNANAAPLSRIRNSRRRMGGSDVHVRRSAPHVQSALLPRQGSRHHAAGSCEPVRAESAASAGRRLCRSLGEIVWQGTCLQRRLGASRHDLG
jgi:Trehalose utilisation